MWLSAPRRGIIELNSTLVFLVLLSTVSVCLLEFSVLTAASVVFPQEESRTQKASKHRECGYTGAESAEYRHT